MKEGLEIVSVILPLSAENSWKSLCNKNKILCRSKWQINFLDFQNFSENYELNLITGTKVKAYSKLTDQQAMFWSPILSYIKPQLSKIISSSFFIKSQELFLTLNPHGSKNHLVRAVIFLYFRVHPLHKITEKCKKVLGLIFKLRSSKDSEDWIINTK